MPCPVMEFMPIPGVVRRLPQEVARFLNSQDWLFGGAVEGKPRVYKRRLRIEPLGRAN